MRYIFNLQLFAAKTKEQVTAHSEEGGSSSHTEGGSTSHTEGGSNSHTEAGSTSNTESTSNTRNDALTATQNQTIGTSASTGGSNTQSQGGSQTNSNGWNQNTSVGQSQSTGHSEGGSTSTSGGKSWASGTVSDKTQAMFDKYGNEFVESQKANDAYQRLQDTIDQKPTFESQYENKLNELYNSIMNRDKFTYDFNADSMYQMYKDKYTESGKRAMEDTMAQANIMNGGYGSSYAQSAGQQSYQNYMQQLNDILPTLRNQAYNEYQDEGNRMLQQYSMTNDAYNREYGQYRDAMSDYQSDRAFNQSAYQDERNFDYNQYANDRNYWNQQYWNEKNAEQSNIQNATANNWNDNIQNTNSIQNTAGTYGQTSDSTNWNNSNSNNWSNTNSMSQSNGLTSSLSNSNTNASSNTNTNSWSDTNTNFWEDTNTRFWQDTQTSSWANSLSSIFSGAAETSASTGAKLAKTGDTEKENNTNTGYKANQNASGWYDSVDGNVSNSIRPDSKLKASDYSKYSEENSSSKIVKTMDNPYKNQLDSRNENSFSNMSDQNIMEMADIYRNADTGSTEFKKLREFLSSLPQNEQQWFSYFIQNNVR